MLMYKPHAIDLVSISSTGNYCMVILSLFRGHLGRQEEMPIGPSQMTTGRRRLLV